MSILSLEYLFIGVGAALGGILRVALGKLFLTPIYGIVTPILLINVLGCFIMGIITALSVMLPDNLRLFIIPGFLGGFTTFSSFALEFGLLYEKNLHYPAFIYAGLTILLSILSFFIGLKLMRLLL